MFMTFIQVCRPTGSCVWHYLTVDFETGWISALLRFYRVKVKRSNGAFRERALTKMIPSS